jgi:N-acetylmuramoyl-L-alanine amidase
MYELKIMKRAIFIISFLFLICLLVTSDKRPFLSKPAEGAETVTIRIGKHQDFIRMVFSAREDYIQGASIILSEGDIIRIDFKRPVDLRVLQKGVEKAILSNGVPFKTEEGVLITAKGNGCFISIENLADINILKLMPPPRLVVDAYVKRQNEEKTVTAPLLDALYLPYESFVIDAGHGGYDIGIRAGNKTEKDIVLSVARVFADIINESGRKAFLTRRGDYSLSLRERINFVNRHAPGVFISLHLSSGQDFTIYTAPQAVVRTAGGREADTGRLIRDIALAKSIAQGLRIEFNRDVVHERMPVPLITYTRVPSIMIEMPHPDKFTYDKRTIERLVNAILKAIAYAPDAQQMN